LSAGQHEAIDVLCPHGDDYEPPTELQYVFDEEDHVGVIVDPDNLLGAWIEADPDDFIDARMWA
jgi:hypothetical protein